MPVAIIGAGPVGLAAAAHLALRDIPFFVIESGKTVGSNVLSWAHVKVFSPWEYNLDKAAVELLETEGWQSPPLDDLPTGQEIFDLYLQPLSEHPLIKPFVYTQCKVVSIAKKSIDKMTNKNRENQPFLINVINKGFERFFEAKAVIDATGTWQNPNPILANGIWTKTEKENHGQIFYGIPEVLGSLKKRFQNKKILVIGSGHSAINSIIELEKLKQEFESTDIHWVMRKNKINEVYGGGDNDALVARGVLGNKIKKLIEDNVISVYTPFHIHQINKRNGKFEFIGYQFDNLRELSGFDEIIVNTGSRPDTTITSELRVEYDSVVESVPALATLIDPNLHSCGTVRAHGEKELTQKEKNFYIVGSKSYGRAPTFLMATGYEQVRSVVAMLAGDEESARRVELVLPETGVCKSDNGEGACCGNVPNNDLEVSACC
ncbi:FAD-dependent oxidoreductase [Leptospira biflexa]|uniref:FAD-dependent oxidoreductase n=1 Tax=Leptospira biflexa TaxID=172 RepID=UPI001AEFA32C|nr:FAD-dependent oxidoreductase [Leptospira biflexa]